jgi:hypothetical protein
MYPRHEIHDLGTPNASNLAHDRCGMLFSLSGLFRGHSDTSSNANPNPPAYSNTNPHGSRTPSR